MLDFKTEVSHRRIIKDASPFGVKVKKFFGKVDHAATAIGSMAAATFMFPVFSEIAFLGALGVWTVFRGYQKTRALPIRIPKSSGMMDPKEVHPGTGKAMKGDGIIFIGNDQETREEIWLTDTQARTHMMFMGTTGSGKAQSLRSSVLTPSGWKKMGTLKEGEEVCIPGGTATILSIHPQGIREMFVLSVMRPEGLQEAECCEEHLWATKVNYGTALKPRWEEQVTRTDELINLFAKGHEIKIPVVGINESKGVFLATEQSWCPLVGISKGSNEPSQCLRISSRDHLYITNGGLVTHNTEFLLSVVYNALIHASGLIYVDGKADSSLYGKIYSMARSCGREDDVRVINFQTGAKDIFGAQPFKMSNTMNPFAVGSSGMLSQMVMGLIASDKKDVWSERANSFVEALMKPLVFLRERYGWLLDVNMVRDYFELKKLETLVWKLNEKYPGLDAQMDGLKSYLANLPTYVPEKYHKQGETALEQHGYITMQLVRTFNSLADTYGYIMRTPLAEIDFLDVFLNRRILVVLLPALEKSPPELSNLGRIIVAAIKATMAVGLGAQIEGDWKKVIDSKPTNSSSPFMCVLDEYGYYAVEGFAVVPAQARSLGFSAIFAGQDLPAFEKASKEEAKSTLANTNTKFCGKLTCVETYEYFNKIGSSAYFARASGYDEDPGLMGVNYKSTQTASIEKFDRIALDDLKGQNSGQWHMFFGNDIVRIKSFYAAPKNVDKLRVNHFIKVRRPNTDEINWYGDAKSKFQGCLFEDKDFEQYIEYSPVRDITIMKEEMARHSDYSSFKMAAAAIAAYHINEEKEIARFQQMISAASSDDDDVMFGDDEFGSNKEDDADPFDDVSFEDEPEEYSGDEEEIDPEDYEFESGNEFEAMDDDGSSHIYEMDQPSNVSRMNQMTIMKTGEGEDFDDEQGTLNRGRTENDLAKIERMLNSGPREAGLAAASATEMIANVTHYPLSAPEMPENPEEHFAGLVDELMDCIGTEKEGD